MNGILAWFNRVRELTGRLIPDDAPIPRSYTVRIRTIDGDEYDALISERRKLAAIRAELTPLLRLIEYRDAKLIVMTKRAKCSTGFVSWDAAKARELLKLLEEST